MPEKTKPQGLTGEFMRRVCCPGADNSGYCRYLRLSFRYGVWGCAKNTAAGLRHSARIEGLLAEERAAAGEVVFDSGRDLQPPEPPLQLKIRAGDNCPGRADEFRHLFPDDPVS